jgi:hypothetical protein
MRFDRNLVCAVAVVAAVLFLCSGANAQSKPFGPPSDQVYFNYSNSIVNYSSDSTSEPPAWNYFPIGSGGLAPEANSPLTSFSYGTEDLVYYIGTDNHIHEAQWDTSKGSSYVDITAASSAPVPAAGSALTSILNGEHGYIYYIAANMHAYEITWTSTGSWTYTDITSTAGAANAGYAGSLGSFIFGGDLEVVYETAAKHIIQVYLNSGSTWKTLDMTSLSGAPLAEAATGLTGFKYPDGHAHVYCFGQPGTGGYIPVLEFYSTSGSWGYDSITDVQFAQPANLTSITSMSFGSSIRVYYETPTPSNPTGNSDIVELHASNEGPGFNGGDAWNYQDLMASPVSLGPASVNSPLASYGNPTTVPATVRLFYVSAPLGTSYVTLAYGYTSSGLDLTWASHTFGSSVKPTALTGTYW